MDESPVVLLPSASMRYSDEELRRMKTRRRELVSEYGDKGQHHPMGRMIGGLNPAAQELHVLRGKIAEAESERRAPSPVLTPLPGSRGGYGLKFDIEYQGRRGKLGTDNFGRWYVIVGEGSEADVLASDFKTKGEAAKAFARLPEAAHEGASRHHATKKSPVQLQREIDAVLARPRAQSPYSVHTPAWERDRLVRKLTREKARLERGDSSSKRAHAAKQSLVGTLKGEPYFARVTFSDRSKRFGPSMHSDQPRWTAFVQGVLGHDATGEGATKEAAVRAAVADLPASVRRHFEGV